MNKQERLELDEAVDPILFYRPQDAYGWASNFSLHSVVMRQPFTREYVEYRTTEHRFQAMKATTFEDHEWVRKSVTAFESKERGGPRGILLREGWGDDFGDLCYLVMLEALLAKAAQHSQIRSALKTTCARHIYEDSPVDDIWGWRFRDDYRGKNLLGEAWMQVREVVT